MNWFIGLVWVSCTVAKSNYDGQFILSCLVKSNDIANKLIDLDILHHKHDKTILRVKNDAEKRYAESVTPCTVLSSNLNQLVSTSKSRRIVKRATKRPLQDHLANNEFFSDYQRYDAIRNQFKYWSKTYPQYTNFVGNIGKSYEGRFIFAMDVTNRNHAGPKRDIIYLGGLHAREWISPATVSYITYRLLKDAESDPAVKEHLNNFIYRIVPVTNPDGYEYTYEEDRFWRKNRRQTGPNTFGVDLNRNWDDHWAEVGSSNSSSSDLYHGTGPNSEPEVKNLVNYIMRFPKRYGAIDWHSYGQLILRNWGWTTTDSKNEPILKELSESMVDAFKSHGHTFKAQKSSGLYSASGSADDFLANKAKMVSLTVELCPNDDIIGFELLPNEIVNCAQGAFAASKMFSQYLLDHPNIPPNEPMAQNYTIKGL